MSETKIVNHVHETAGLKVERARLELETVAELPESVTAPVEPEPQPTQAYVEGLGEYAARKSEDSQDHLKQIFGQAYVQGLEFDEFKSQVIAAFKHLGLDTRKFFAE